VVAAGSWSRLDARDLRATADVEMAEMGALGDQFQDADVAHLGAASHFDMSQFGASATQRLQSSVR